MYKSAVVEKINNLLSFFKDLFWGSHNGHVYRPRTVVQLTILRLLKKYSANVPNCYSRILFGG
jgi:hypothetical protein